MLLNLVKMKRFYFILILISLFSPYVANVASPLHTSTAETKDVSVYITRTGEKYHRGTCKYLRQSKISIGKKEAVRIGYSACKVCKP